MYDSPYLVPSFNLSVPVHILELAINFQPIVIQLLNVEDCRAVHLLHKLKFSNGILKLEENLILICALHVGGNW